METAQLTEATALRGFEERTAELDLRLALLFLIVILGWLFVFDKCDEWPATE